MINHRSMEVIIMFNYKIFYSFLCLTLLSCTYINATNYICPVQYKDENGSLIDNNEKEWVAHDNILYKYGDLNSNDTKTINPSQPIYLLAKRVLISIKDISYWQNLYALFGSVSPSSTYNFAEPEVLVPIPDAIDGFSVPGNTQQIGVNAPLSVITLANNSNQEEEITFYCNRRFKLRDISNFTELTGIYAGSFENIKENGEYLKDDTITNLIIPSNCKYIGDRAFKGQVCLKNVTIKCTSLLCPSSLSSLSSSASHIETSSFEDCDAIEKFTFSGSETSSQSTSVKNFVTNLTNGNAVTTINYSAKVFAKNYYERGYTVSNNSTGTELYIEKTPLKIKDSIKLYKTIDNGTINLKDNEFLDLSGFGKNQGKPKKNQETGQYDYEMYMRVTPKEENDKITSNWIKSKNDGLCNIPIQKPGVYEIESVAISKNPAFKSTHNELKNEDNRLTYKDDNGTNVDLGEVENE